MDDPGAALRAVLAIIGAGVSLWEAVDMVRRASALSEARSNTVTVPEATTIARGGGTASAPVLLLGEVTSIGRSSMKPLRTFSGLEAVFIHTTRTRVLRGPALSLRRGLHIAEVLDDHNLPGSSVQEAAEWGLMSRTSDQGGQRPIEMPRITGAHVTTTAALEETLGSLEPGVGGSVLVRGGNLRMQAGSPWYRTVAYALRRFKVPVAIEKRQGALTVGQVVAAVGTLEFADGRVQLRPHSLLGTLILRDGGIAQMISEARWAALGGASVAVFGVTVAWVLTSVALHRNHVSMSRTVRGVVDFPVTVWGWVKAVWRRGSLLPDPDAPDPSIDGSIASDDDTSDGEVDEEVGGAAPGVADGTATECIVCCERKRNAIFLECGHFAACFTCARRCFSTRGGRKCPICRTRSECKQLS